MKRKQKVMLAALLLCFGVIGYMMFFRQGNQPAESGEGKTNVLARQSYPRDSNASETVTSQGGPGTSALQTEGSKYNQDKSKEMTVDTSYLSNFLGDGKQFILKRQIQQLVGGEAKTAACLPYTRSDPEGMRQEFYILLDTGGILQGFYGFQSGKTQVEVSDLTEEDVWALQEEDEAQLKREQEEAEESERKRAEEEAKKAAREAKAAKKAARKQRESETQTEVLPETENETGSEGAKG